LGVLAQQVQVDPAHWQGTAAVTADDVVEAESALDSAGLVACGDEPRARRGDGVGVGQVEGRVGVGLDAKLRPCPAGDGLTALGRVC
jgi:hypothetical protein